MMQTRAIDSRPLGRVPLWSKLTGGLAVSVVLVLLAATVGRSQDAAPAARPAPPTPDELFDRLDLDANGYLEPAEIFDAEPDLTELSQMVLYPQHRPLFPEADQDGDGLLTSAEWRIAERLRKAYELERYARRVLRPAFQQADADANARLSYEEWMEGVPESRRQQSAWGFAVCDFDRSRDLTFSEYCTIPGRVSAETRSEVPDPVADQARRLEALFAASADERSFAAVSAVLRGAGLNLVADDVARWDADRNGTLSPLEIRVGLRLAFGVELPGVGAIRSPQGLVFRMREFRAYDKDGSGALSRQEFAEGYWDRKNADTLFEQMDLNHDDSVSLAEAVNTRPLWLDTLSDFKRMDVNLDGALTAAEIQQTARSFEEQFASRAIPLFDTNQDGRLSFLEYRFTPPANPAHEWNSRRADLDADGRLSLTEFHASDSTRGLALSALFFDRFDANRDNSLTRDEFDFHIDLGRVAPEVAFAVIDLDHDNLLTLEELLQHRPHVGGTGQEREYRLEEQAMKFEDAYLDADADQNQKLTAAEFMSAAPLQALLGYRTSRTPAREAVAAQGILERLWAGEFRILLLVGLNLVVLTGLIWLMRRPAGGR